MMFPNPHDFHTAISMLPGSHSGDDGRAPRRMVRAPGKRGENGVIMIIVVSFIVGFITPFASKLIGI